MKKRTIISLVLAGGLIAGTGFGVRVLADDSQTTSIEQFQREGITLGNPWEGMSSESVGYGRMGGCFNRNQLERDLSLEQEKELNSLRTQAQNIMLEYREAQWDLNEELDAAISKGDREEILTVWSKHTTMNEEIQTALKPLKESMEGLVGVENYQGDFMGNHFGLSFRNEKMIALENAANEEEALEIIKELQNFGMGRSQRQEHPGRGRGLKRYMPEQGDPSNEITPRRGSWGDNSKTSNFNRSKGMNKNHKGFGGNRR